MNAVDQVRVELDNLKSQTNKMSTCVMMNNEIQARQLWQKGAENWINGIQHEISTFNDYKKGMAEYVTTIDMRLHEAEKMIDRMCKLVKVTDEPVKQSSQKYLEKCLKDRNEYIRVLESKLKNVEDQLGERNNECQNALNKANNFKTQIEVWQRAYNLTVDRERTLEKDNEALQRIIYEREQEITRYIDQLKKEKEGRISNPFKHGDCCE